MQVKDWMATELVTVAPETPVLTAAQILKSRRIRRLPVLDKNGLLVGIVSDRDLKEAAPSKATTIDVHEHHYLLGEMKVEAIMTRPVLTVAPTDTVEKAAALMIKHKITGLPVVDGKRPVGILTTDDVARVLTAMTGFFQGGVQFCLRMNDTPGEARHAADIVRQRGGRIVSVMLVSDAVDEGVVQLYLRASGLDSDAVRELSDELSSRYFLQYVAVNEVASI